jgi:hypothetical protein
MTASAEATAMIVLEGSGSGVGLGASQERVPVLTAAAESNGEPRLEPRRLLDESLDPPTAAEEVLLFWDTVVEQLKGWQGSVEGGREQLYSLLGMSVVSNSSYTPADADAVAGERALWEAAGCECIMSAWRDIERRSKNSPATAAAAPSNAGTRSSNPHAPYVQSRDDDATIHTMPRGPTHTTSGRHTSAGTAAMEFFQRQQQQRERKNVERYSKETDHVLGKEEERRT